MTHLLRLVDRLIGDTLQGNLFTDTDPFRGNYTNTQRPQDAINQSNTPFTNAQSGRTPDGVRNAIYQGSNRGRSPSNTPQSILDLASFHQQGESEFTRGGTNSAIPTPSFNKGESFSRRNDIYADRNSINSNIGGAPQANGVAVSRPTLGDANAAAGKPPNPSLLFQGNDTKPDRVSLVGPQGNLRASFQDGHRLGNIYDDSGTNPNPAARRGGRFGSNMPGPSRYLDFFAVSHWLRNIARETGAGRIQDNNTSPGEIRRTPRTIEKGVSLLTTQALLTFMNPGDPENGGTLNQIFNPIPAQLLAGAIPGSRLTQFLGPTIAVVGGQDYKSNAEFLGFLGADRLRSMRDGTYVKGVDGNQINQFRLPDKGFRGDITSVGQTQTLQSINGLASPAGQIDDEGAEGRIARSAGVHQNIYTQNRPYNQDNAVLPLNELNDLADTFGPDFLPTETKIAELFDPRPFPGAGAIASGQTLTWVSRPSALQRRGMGELFDAPGLGQNATGPSVRVTPNDDPEVGVTEKEIPDSELYMPFMFQDLRDNPPKFLYFRAFLKEGLSETFTPDWQVERYYGRVDQIPVYMGTIRSLNFAFDIVAWSPSDLPLMWKKIKKLQSMAYPEFDKLGFLRSGPLIRIRVGDLFATSNKKGLPGYINSMDFSFDDGIWNIKDNFKIPRKVTVSVGFTVVHDGNPGIYPVQKSDFNSDTGTFDLANTSGGRTFGAGNITIEDSRTIIDSQEGEFRGINKTLTAAEKEKASNGG